MRVKKSERKQLKVWAENTRKRFDNKCAICGLKHGSINQNGNKIYCQAHHLMKQKELRFNPKNGICLCPKHHKYSVEISSHNNPLMFAVWYQTNFSEDFEYLVNYVGALL